MHAFGLWRIVMMIISRDQVLKDKDARFRVPYVVPG